MSQQSSRDEIGVRYLLRTLSEAEREQLEEQYFSDDAEFYDLEIAEDEVVDRYVGGKLAPAELERFEEMLASSPRLADRVKMARILAKEIELDSRRQASAVPSAVVTPGPKKRSWWNRWFGSELQLTPAFSFSMVTAMAFVLLTMTGLILGWMNSRRATQQLASDKAQIEVQIQRLQNEIDKERAAAKKLDEDLRTNQDELSAMEKELEALKAKLSAVSPGATVAITTPVTLVPGALRGSGSSAVVRVGPTTSAVAVTLQLQTNEYSLYNVIVETPERRRVHREGGLRPRDSGSGPTISFRVDAKKLPRGDYIVYLEAAGSNEPVDEYYFRVVPARALP